MPDDVLRYAYEWFVDAAWKKHGPFIGCLAAALGGLIAIVGSIVLALYFLSG